MNVGVDHGINVSSKLSRVNSSRAVSGIGDSSPRNEAAALNGPQLTDWCAIATNDQGPPSLYFAKHNGGLVAQLALCDGSGLHKRHCSSRSTL